MWIFTNGYLLTEDVIDLLLRCHVPRVHIPLDGVGATNDAMRRLVGGGLTYDWIIENLGLLNAPIRSLIRTNTHAGNVGEIDELEAGRRSVTGRQMLRLQAAALVRRRASSAGSVRQALVPGVPG